MALTLEKTLYNGTVTRYHRITSFTLDPELGMATALLESYADEQHRALPALSHSKESFTFTWSGYGETLGQEAYAHIKSLPEWAAAVDV
jgi:hypothetical protein